MTIAVNSIFVDDIIYFGKGRENSLGAPCTQPDYKRLAGTLHVLSDVDALRIFNEASKGFKSGKKAIKNIGLTPRKYYRSLSSLIEAGLVTASDRQYKVTALGEIVHNLIFHDLNGFLASNRDAQVYMQEASGSRQISVIKDYDKAIKFIVKAIDNAKSEILVATRFVDFTVIQSLAYALMRGVKLKTLNDTKLDYPAFFKVITGMFRDLPTRYTKFALNVDENYRAINVPFSFIVVDDGIAFLELPYKQFKTAFVLSDREVIKTISEFFWDIWSQSESLNVPKL